MSTPTSFYNDNLSDDPSSPPSPTLTIRNATSVRPPSAAQDFAPAAASPGRSPAPTAGQPGMNTRQSGQQQQQELGKGYPGRDDLVSGDDQGVVAWAVTLCFGIWSRNVCSRTDVARPAYF